MRKLHISRIIKFIEQILFNHFSNNFKTNRRMTENQKKMFKII